MTKAWITKAADGWDVVFDVYDLLPQSQIRRRHYFSPRAFATKAAAEGWLCWALNRV